MSENDPIITLDIIEGQLTLRRTSRFRLLTEYDLENIPRPDYLIENILLAGSLACVYGPSGIGKSFLALDIACSIASNHSFLGHSVKQGPVVYVAAEGFKTMLPRTKAWRNARQIRAPLPDLFFVETAVQLYDETEIRELLVETIASLGERKPSIIIFDTYAKCTINLPENDATITDVILDRCGLITRETGATVLLIHHSGNDEYRLRGSTALKASLDTLIRIGGTSKLTMYCDKSRYGAPFDDIEFELISYDEGCIVERRENTKNGGDGPIASHQRKMLIALATASSAKLSNSEWRQSVDISNSSFNQNLAPLQKYGYVTSTGEGKRKRYSITESGKACVTPHSNIATPDRSNDDQLLQLPSPIKGESSDVVTNEEHRLTDTNDHGSSSEGMEPDHDLQ